MVCHLLCALLLEAAKVKGFSPKDAKTTLEIAASMHGANPKALRQMENRLKVLYSNNFEALKRRNAIEKADTKNDKKKRT